MRCVYCGNEMPDASKFCPACGGQRAAKPVRVCEKCGRSIGEGQAFCTSCGAKAAQPGMGAGAPPPPPPPAPEPGTFRHQDATPVQPPNNSDPPPRRDTPPAAGPARPSAEGQPLKGAGVGIRAAATVVDMIIFAVFSYPLAAASGTATSGGFELMGASFFMAVIGVFMYYLLSEGTLGATPGKLLLGVRVVKKDGGKAGLGAAAARTVFRVIDGFAFYLPAAILVWVTSSNQRLGDIVAGTLVVKRGK